MFQATNKHNVVVLQLLATNWLQANTEKLCPQLSTTKLLDHFHGMSRFERMIQQILTKIKIIDMSRFKCMIEQMLTKVQNIYKLNSHLPIS